MGDVANGVQNADCRSDARHAHSAIGLHCAGVKVAPTCYSMGASAYYYMNTTLVDLRCLHVH